MLKQEQCATIKNDDSVKVSTINYRVKIPATLHTTSLEHNT